MRPALFTTAIIAAASSFAVSAAPPGETAFQVCGACHSVDPGQERFGPNLAGVVGRKAGSEAGYAYSPAMAAAGFAWTPKRLDAFLVQPGAVVPGTKMAFAGVSDPASRKAIIDYLANLPK
jgi:cytochrome c